MLERGEGPGMVETGRTAAVRRALPVVAALLTAVAVLGSAALAEPALPDLAGRITDEAGLLGAADRAAIEQELAALEATSTDQLAVVTVKSLQGYAIEEFAIALARKWGIGQAGKDNGVVLLVAPAERKVRIEVGRRLESMLTDTMSKLIIENAILPAFRRGDFGAGIRAGVRDIKDVLLGDADAVKERAKSGGGGSGPDTMALLLLALWIAIVVFVIYAQMRHAHQMPQTVGRRRRRAARDGSIVVIPSGSGHWDSGWSGGDSGGGGWSGGGGGFGGGGASGGW